MAAILCRAQYALSMHLPRGSPKIDKQQLHRIPVVITSQSKSSDR